MTDDAPNPMLRDHVTSAAFTLTLGKTHVAELVRMDMELAAEVCLDGRLIGKMSRYDMTARHGLEARGLIVHVWADHEHLYKTRPYRNYFGGAAGQMTYSEDWPENVHPAHRYHMTRAGRLVCDLLMETGQYQELAGSLLPLIEAARKTRKPSPKLARRAS